MERPILFSLEHCTKCTQTKELLEGREDIDVVTFPHDLSEWNDEQRALAQTHDVMDDLQLTAPILCLDGEKKVGYLRIRKWIQQTK